MGRWRQRDWRPSATLANIIDQRIKWNRQFDAVAPKRLHGRASRFVEWSSQLERKFVTL